MLKLILERTSTVVPDWNLSHLVAWIASQHYKACCGKKLISQLGTIVIASPRALLEAPMFAHCPSHWSINYLPTPTDFRSDHGCQDATKTLAP